MGLLLEISVNDDGDIYNLIYVDSLEDICMCSYYSWTDWYSKSLETTSWLLWIPLVVSDIYSHKTMLLEMEWNIWSSYK